jgi:hypothetical protein
MPTKRFPYIYVLMLIGLGLISVVTLRVLDPPAQPVPGVLTGEALVLEGQALGAAGSSPEQTHSFTNGGLKIRVAPNQPAPTPAERGVRILLTPDRAEHINDQSVIIEVRYSAPARAAATGLAVSLQGIGPADWDMQPIGAREGVARFALPAQFAVNAIGLRALSDAPNQSGALTITQIRITPAPITTLVSAPEAPIVAPAQP